jgi:hypothetical protein
MIDPPGGWRYGFPKAYDRVADGDDMMAWLVKEGYPQAEIDRMGDQFHVRQWEELSDDDPGFQLGVPINPKPYGK